MSRIWTPWTRQPQVPVGIDPRVIAYSFGGTIRFPQKSYSKSTKVGPAGLGIQEIVTTADAPAHKANEVTVLVVAKAASLLMSGFAGQTGATFIGRQNETYSSLNVGICTGTAWSDGNTRPIIMQAAASKALTAAGDIIVSTNSTLSICGWHQGVSNAFVACNGVGGVAKYNNYSAPTVADQSDYYLNILSGGNNNLVYLSAYLKGILSQRECIELSLNPWQIFQPIQRRIFVDMGAGGGLSINATAGTASADGFSASVDRQLAIAASLGLASADGHQASINLQRDIAATLGTATASGYSATINRQRDIAASLGTATAQGYGASISFGNDLNIAASLGIASADGYQANVNLQRDIAASLGTAAALGYQASISDTDPLHGFTQDQLDFLVAYMEANMAIPTAAEIATAIYANTIDGKTLTQHIRLLSAVLGGKVSGAGTGTETFRDIADTVDRVVATVDSSGNRTAITLDLD